MGSLASPSSWSRRNPSCRGKRRRIRKERRGRRSPYVQHTDEHKISYRLPLSPFHCLFILIAQENIQSSIWVNREVSKQFSGEVLLFFYFLKSILIFTFYIFRQLSNYLFNLISHININCNFTYGFDKLTIKLYISC